MGRRPGWAVEVVGGFIGRSQPGAEEVRIGDGGAKANAAETGAIGLELGHGEGDQVAALGARHGVDFVDHHGLQLAEHQVRLGVAQQQHQAFGCGDEQVGRLLPLALAAVLRGVAGAAFDRYGQVERLDQGQDIAFNIDI